MPLRKNGHGNSLKTVFVTVNYRLGFAAQCWRPQLTAPRCQSFQSHNSSRVEYLVDLQVMTDMSVENTTYVPNEGDVDALKALFRNTQGEILQIVVEAYWLAQE